MTQSSAVNFGTCWGTPGGQDLSSPSYMASGFQVVGEAIARRWSTSSGELIDDTDYGYNVTDLVGEAMSVSQIAQLNEALAHEAEKDERVLACSVVVTFASGALTVTGQVTTAQGPFKLVLGVSSVSPPTLQVSA